MTDKSSEIQSIANEIAERGDTDVLLVNSHMGKPVDSEVIGLCRRRIRRSNVLIIPVTYGGDANVAYRIARCLQIKYNRVIAMISGQCKSAGTLVAIGAHEIIISDEGELGPLDVQLIKEDDLGVMRSGMTADHAFAALQEAAEEMFETFALDIKRRSAGQITFKTASDIASTLTSSLFGNIYAQIEVMHLGEAARAMKLAEEYGNRLNEKSQNLKGSALANLVAGYPSHRFVIDEEEAGKIFNHIRG